MGTFKEKISKSSILKDLYERIVGNWPSTVVAIIAGLGLYEWKKGDITTEELVTYAGVVLTLASFFYKESRKDDKPSAE